MLAEQHKVYGLAGVNLPLIGIQAWLTKIAPVLSVILIIAQIAVAIATIIYTIRQIRGKVKKK